MLTRLTLRLPAGMRDVAPDEATAQCRVAETRLRVGERAGFGIVPVSDHGEVLAPGLCRSRRAAAVASRHRDDPGPHRHGCEGAVARLDEPPAAGGHLGGIARPRCAPAARRRRGPKTRPQPGHRAGKKN